MKTQVIIMDRRHHPREGVFAEIANLTYSVLRKHGINGPTEQPAEPPYADPHVRWREGTPIPIPSS